MHVLVFWTTCKIYTLALSNITYKVGVQWLYFAGIRSSKQSLCLAGLSAEFSDVFQGLKGVWTFYLL